MKKQLLLSALALLGAGVIGGCCNCGSNCGSNGGDCDDFVAVEAIEVVPCPSKEKCRTKSHHHVRQKTKDQKGQNSDATNCTDTNCSARKTGALASCGGNHDANTGNGNTTDHTGSGEAGK
ncbi:MAG: hypothetical protein IKC89_03680 [Lentisphaeria bacterium]|nr:hypothetical protein [Lentisphaeria bacterium]